MPRGGIHKGTLRPTWKAGKTTTVRLPAAKKNEILAVARALDALDSEGKILDAQIYRDAIDILRGALSLPKNNGSKYGAAIKEALTLLGEPAEPLPLA
jgi:hypothetical protein